MKHLLRPIMLSLLWVSVGLACKKTDIQPCEQEGCCTPKVTSRLSVILNGVSIGRLNQNSSFKEWPFLELRDVIYDTELYYEKQKQIKGATLCDNEGAKLDVFLAEQKQTNDYKPSQEYRVWGWAYEDTWTSTTFPDRIYALKINRIERMP